MGSKLSKAYFSSDGTKYYIRENSFIAKLAALKLNAKAVAIVTGDTINLYNTSKEMFLQDEEWLRHELCHIKQYREHGYAGFIFKYLAESVKSGYYNNKFEKEAREAERELLGRKRHF